jgi:hypothetical protein
MEASTVHSEIVTAPAPPRAKDGGVAAGISAVIREIGEMLNGAGGLVVVSAGVFAVLLITSTSMGTVPAEERATVATAAFTVLGTIVGAYFGVRVGARGKEEAESQRAVAAEKVERLAAHLNPEQAHKVLDDVGASARRAVQTGRSPIQ